MKKIGRPRKSERKENISVNLPKALVDEINNQLSYFSSRSEWVQLAIEEKLGASFTVSESTTLQLLAALYHREDITDFCRKVIESDIKLMTQVAETVEEQ